MSQLETQHPLLMVPRVYSFSVMIYTVQGSPVWPAETIRDALTSVLPPGTGVGAVSCVSHGIYEERQS